MPQVGQSDIRPVAIEQPVNAVLSAAPASWAGEPQHGATGSNGFT